MTIHNWDGFVLHAGLPAIEAEVKAAKAKLSRAEAEVRRAEALFFKRRGQIDRGEWPKPAGQCCDRCTHLQTAWAGSDEKGEGK